MKKLLLSLGLVSAMAVNAQMDTIANHFSFGPTLYGSGGSGYVSGNNDYGDTTKMQLFDANHGITGAGTITNVLLAMPVKNDNGGSFQVKLWANNAGQPGAELAAVSMTLAQLDTSLAAYGAGTDFIYNVNAPFNVAVPANGSFWAGIVLPKTAGDTTALFTSDTTFADAVTHTGEHWNDGTFHFFGDPTNWDMKVSLAVFPVINFGTAAVAQKDLKWSVYPNPAANVLNFNLNANAAEVVVMTMDGKKVLANLVNGMSGSIDISTLEAGMYMYVISTESGAQVTNTFIKK